VAVIARDVRRGLTAVQPPAQTAPVQSAETAAETTLKKAAKKRCLREKRAAEHTTASPTTVANAPAATTIDSKTLITAEHSPNQIGTDVAAATTKRDAIASIPPNTNFDTFSITQREKL
jgi:hypothetical protein